MWKQPLVHVYNIQIYRYSKKSLSKMGKLAESKTFSFESILFYISNLLLHIESSSSWSCDRLRDIVYSWCARHRASMDPSSWRTVEGSSRIYPLLAGLLHRVVYDQRIINDTPRVYDPSKWISHYLCCQPSCFSHDYKSQ